MARDNLRDRPNVAVVQGDAGEWPRDEVDRIYVNFAVTAPPAPWLERLAPGGRLLLPLGVPAASARPGGPRVSEHGAALLIERRDNGFAASHVCTAYFIHAEGGPAAGDDDDVARLREAFRGGGVEFVKSLIWQRPAEPGRCWFCSAGWSLGYDPP